ncbi:hypothetical protein ACFQT0_24565 [Hymenobacter humi]|uniref:Translation initiation factor IF-2 n=1 Tax=Hymenobacter humi TaxID=1411620 RepID=A0ABW2UBH5_9BACT
MRISVLFPALALVLLGGHAAQAQDEGPRQARGAPGDAGARPAPRHPGPAPAGNRARGPARHHPPRYHNGAPPRPHALGTAGVRAHPGGPACRATTPAPPASRWA